MFLLMLMTVVYPTSIETTLLVMQQPYTNTQVFAITSSIHIQYMTTFENQKAYSPTTEAWRAISYSEWAVS